MNIVRNRSFRFALVGTVLATALSTHSASAADDSWQFSAGAGVINRPKYPGSSDSKVQALPLFSASYGRFFIGGVPGAGTPAGLGVYLYQDDRWRLGAAVSGDVTKPRKESDDPRLHGLGDINGTARGNVFASYTIDWFTVRGNVSSDIGGKKQGTLASLDLEAKYSPFDRLVFTAGPGLTWADGQYTRTFFGIDAEQSTRSGLAIYTAKRGINTVRFSLGANYRLSQNWGLGARMTAARLRNDAADSPITADKSQNTFGVFANYRF